MEDARPPRLLFWYTEPTWTPPWWQGRTGMACAGTWSAFASPFSPPPQGAIANSFCCRAFPLPASLPRGRERKEKHSAGPQLGLAFRRLFSPTQAAPPFPPSRRRRFQQASTWPKLYRACSATSVRRRLFLGPPYHAGARGRVGQYSCRAWLEGYSPAGYWLGGGGNRAWPA